MLRRSLRVLSLVVLTLGFASGAMAQNNCVPLSVKPEPNEINALKSCAESLYRQLQQRNSEVSDIKVAIENAWLVAPDHGRLLDIVNLKEPEPGATLGQRWKRIYFDLGKSLTGEDYDQIAFERFRVKYIEPEAIIAFLDKYEGTIVGAIASAAVKGLVHDDLVENWDLLTKKLSLETGIAASDWALKQCWKSTEEQLNEVTCKKIASFPGKYKEAYGVDVTENRAYALGILYRRHLNGGPQAVIAWQTVGKRLAKLIGVEAAQTAEAPKAAVAQPTQAPPRNKR